MKVQDMNFTIQYVAGEQNLFSDLMSRPEGVKRSSREELMKTYQQKTLNVVLSGAQTRTMEWLNLIKSLQTQEVLDSTRSLPDEIMTYKELKCTRSDSGNWRIIMSEQLRFRCLQ